MRPASKYNPQIMITGFDGPQAGLIKSILYTFHSTSSPLDIATRRELQLIHISVFQVQESFVGLSVAFRYKASET